MLNMVVKGENKAPFTKRAESRKMTNYYTAKERISNLYKQTVKTSHYFTKSFDIKYRKLKLWATYSMFFWCFPIREFFKLFCEDLGRSCWIISVTSEGLNPESFANDSTIFGSITFLSFRIPNVARMYSSFATSISWNTLCAVYNRIWKNHLDSKNHLFL